MFEPSRKIILMNASEEILNIIDWKDAIKLVLSGKARKSHQCNKEYEIKTVSGILKLPSKVVLSKYIYIPYRSMKINKNNLMKRDNAKCSYCGKELTNISGTIDHINPQSRGGGHTWDNVVLSCLSCNKKKSDLTLDEFESKYGIKLNSKPTIYSTHDYINDIKESVYSKLQKAQSC